MITRAHPLALLALPLALFAACSNPKKTDDAKGSTNASASSTAEGFRDEFPVEKSKLVATGKSSYFSLLPGTVHTYRGGKTLLTITVLDETKLVDGVTTRVVEEREEKGGVLEEVSRNFFAMDPNNGDVYYFGEEVDEYEDGKLKSHGGAWLAGEKGARFGLMIPGKPAKGDRFYQELAPKVAMDRFEIVSVDEPLETPAGAFPACVHAKETTPLEKGTGHKWYAPGVGLVKDDSLALVSYVFPSK